MLPFHQESENQSVLRDSFISISTFSGCMDPQWQELMPKQISFNFSDPKQATITLKKKK